MNGLSSGALLRVAPAGPLTRHRDSGGSPRGQWSGYWDCQGSWDLLCPRPVICNHSDTAIRQ